MVDRRLLAELLSRVFADSRWDESALLERCNSVFGKTFRWCKPLVERLVASFPERPSAATLTAFVLGDEDFLRAQIRRSPNYRLVGPTGEMRSVLPEEVNAPSLCTTRELATWLGLKISELDWFADLKCFSRHAKSEQLRHYRYRVLAKRFGAVRLIESPKPRLMAIQRHILRQILDQIAPHNAAHGFRLGRSITTFATPHVNHAVVARLDLKDFFPRLTHARVAALFRAIGYPNKVAKLLSGLCTTTTPSRVWGDYDPPLLREPLQHARSLYGVPHVPQGSPTSPSIANLCAYRLDSRLDGLARSAGANYTRYADDLAFSGGAVFARRVKRFLTHVAATVAEEGFVVHHRKTRIMRDGVRQHLAGVVVNRRINLRRSEYDRLKATLVNCLRSGVSGQNRHSYPDFRAHLHGRIAFVSQINPERGNRLREIFDNIQW